MNIVFMGTPEYAKVILGKLIEDNSCNVGLVLTQPDRPVGRKKVLTPPAVKVLAQESGIEVLQPLSLKDTDIQETIRGIKPDVIIVAAFGQLLPKEILDIAPCINLHASILPEYRGASPIQQGLLNADEYLGVTAMLMDEGLDTGDILGFRFVKREEIDRLDIAMERLSSEAAELTLSVLKNYNSLEPITQNSSVSSKCPKIKREDGLVLLNDANEVYRKYSAFYGWPGIFLESGLKLFGVELINCNKKNKSGEILDIIDEAILVGCDIGVIKISGIQPPSKAKMNAKSYIVGKRITIGDTLF